MVSMQEISLLSKFLLSSFLLELDTTTCRLTQNISLVQQAMVSMLAMVVMQELYLLSKFLSSFFPLEHEAKLSTRHFLPSPTEGRQKGKKKKC
jgi:hypothetical protein